MALLVNTPTMPKTLPLLHGNVTLESALDSDDNMLQRIAYPDLRFEFYLSLFKRRSDIEAIVSHHLRLRKTETCHLAEFKDWKAGSFNVCIPVNINNWATFPNKRVIITDGFCFHTRLGSQDTPATQMKSYVVKLLPSSATAFIENI